MKVHGVEEQWYLTYPMRYASTALVLGGQVDANELKERIANGEKLFVIAKRKAKEC